MGISACSIEDFSRLLSRKGRTNLEIDSRQIEFHSVPQVVAVMQSVMDAPTPPADSLSHRDELHVLAKISQAISTGRNSDEFLGNLWRELGLLFPYTGATVSLWNSETEQLVVKASKL